MTWAKNMTTFVRTVAPTIEPITLAEAKLSLRVDGADEDTLITGLIVAAREQAESILGRSLTTQTWMMLSDQFDDVLALQWGPTISVSSVQYVDTAGTLTTLPTTDYVVDIYGTPGRILPTSADGWPETHATQPNTVRVTYTAGYGSTAAHIPASIRQWVTLAVGDMYLHRERSAERPSVPQDFADGLLDGHRVREL